MVLEGIKMTTSEGICSMINRSNSELSSLELQSKVSKQTEMVKNDAGVPKDVSRKKKVNRSTKLKQCKLDARREQWLSQGKNKGVGRQSDDSGNLGTSREGKKVGGARGELPTYCDLDSRSSRSSKSSIGEDDIEGSSLQDSDNESVVNNLGSPIGKENNIQRQQRHGCSSGSCSGCIQDSDNEPIVNNLGNATIKDNNVQGQQRPSSSGSSCSGCVSENEDGSLDDWEAVADALSLNNELVSKSSAEKAGEETAVISQFQKKACFSMKAEMHEILKPEYKVKVGTFTNRTVRIGDARAWRPDDASRPITLPSLSKQHSFPTQSVQPPAWCSINWNNSATACAPPASCPICYEDLDVTDSNFVPCACGFRLCLFCHKRIIEEDGRCPGCRKHYAPLDAITKVPISPRLPRSCSMR